MARSSLQGFGNRKSGAEARAARRRKSERRGADRDIFQRGIVWGRLAMLELIIGLLSGAVGGNLAAKVLPRFDLGTLWNSAAGILGGGLGASIIAMLLGSAAPEGAIASDAAVTLPGIISAVVSGGVGGGVLLAIVGVIRKMMGGAA
jgi:hypothetical protein